MFRFSRPERKIILLVLLSLMTAAVCFGGLESSGLVEEPAVTIGGAFVGFLMTFLAVNRAWRDDSLRLDTDERNDGSDFACDEVLKLWDFRNLSGKRDGNVAVLDDYCQIKKLGDVQDVRFHYATSGDILEPTCLTHPETSHWDKFPEPSHSGGNHHKLCNEYRLTVDLGELADGQSVPLITQLRYQNAFDPTSSEQWLETHIDRPTGRLGVMIVLPESMRCGRASAEEQVGRSEWAVLPQKPAVLQNGTVIYWSFDNPKLSARYQIKWTWTKRKSGRPAVASAPASVRTAPTT